MQVTRQKLTYIDPSKNHIVEALTTDVDGVVIVPVVDMGTVVWQLIHANSGRIIKQEDSLAVLLTYLTKLQSEAQIDWTMSMKNISKQYGKDITTSQS